MSALFLTLPVAARRPLATTLAAGWCAAVLGTATAADVLVVTDSHHPVQAPAGVRIIELDQPARIESELAAHLPADPDKAAALVQQRLREGGTDLQRRIGHSYQGVADAWGLGIAKIPAVVVDRRYVVYGESDVARAVARIHSYRSARP
jgi:integrating conjugative element protein (TIGR03757 family)